MTASSLVERENGEREIERNEDRERKERKREGERKRDKKAFSMKWENVLICRIR